MHKIIASFVLLAVAFMPQIGFAFELKSRVPIAATETLFSVDVYDTDFSTYCSFDDYGFQVSYTYNNLNDIEFGEYVASTSLSIDPYNLSIFLSNGVSPNTVKVSCISDINIPNGTIYEWVLAEDGYNEAALISFGLYDPNRVSTTTSQDGTAYVTFSGFLLFFLSMAIMIWTFKRRSS